MDNLLKYLLENKEIICEQGENVKLSKEDPDVFNDEEDTPEKPTDEDELPLEDEEDIASPDGGESPEGGMDSPEPSDTAGGVPTGGEPTEEPEKPADELEIQEEPTEIKKTFIGQSGDNFYYLEPVKEGEKKYNITNQYSESVFNSEGKEYNDVFSFLTDASEELEISMWTREVIRDFFMPHLNNAIAEDNEETVEAEPEITDEKPEPESSEEEDIFMEPEDKPFESKKLKGKPIMEYLVSSFKFGGQDHKIVLVQDHSTKNSLFEIDGVRHLFSPAVTSEYRVDNHKFTEDSLSAFGEFIYDAMADDARPEM